MDTTGWTGRQTDRQAKNIYIDKIKGRQNILNFLLLDGKKNVAKKLIEKYYYQLTKVIIKTCDRPETMGSCEVICITFEI